MQGGGLVLLEGIIDAVVATASFFGPAGCVGISATIVALWSFHVAAAVNIRNKRVDVISGCNLRYDALAQIKTDIIASIHRKNGPSYETIQHNVELYHRRYWGLKSDQLDYWLAGHIDPETIISWFMSTIDAIHRPDDVWALYSTKGGWAQVKEFHRTTNHRLFQLIEALCSDEVARKGAEEMYAYIYFLFDQIERDEHTLINLLQRNTFRRFSMGVFKPALPRAIAELYLPHVFRAERDAATQHEHSIGPKRRG